MKIGIDAKWLYSGVISGRLFIQNILTEMIALYPEIEWHVFLNRKDKREDKLLDRENVKVHYVWAGFNMLSNLFILPRYARKLELDAVFFQTFSPKGRSYRSIVFIHDVLSRSHPHFFSFKENLYLFPLRWTISSADKVITTTEFVKNELLKYKYIRNSSAINLAPSGVTSCFKPVKEQDADLLRSIKEKFHLPASYLLFTGRINKRKNIQGLLTALTLLSDKEIPLVIVGEADSKQADLQKILSHPVLKNRVHFTGTVSDEELSAIYAMATVFCFPSFAEGFGLPPLEAMASGVPVIVSNTTSMPEACGNAATFVDPYDPKSIAAGIDELLVNNNIREQKIAEGIAWSAQYTWKRTAELFIQSVEQLVKVNKQDHVPAL
jgi:glycosyltransferase involved in cell wall biosynthesis